MQRRHLPRSVLVVGLRTVLAFTAVAVASCSPTLEDVCKREAAEFGAEIAQHRQWFVAEASGRGRSLASTAEATAEAQQRAVRDAEEREQDNRDRLQSWAMRRLEQMQRALDVTEETHLRPAHRALGDLSNAMVGFYGYASEGKWDRAQILLDRIEQQRTQVVQLACKTK